MASFFVDYKTSIGNAKTEVFPPLCVCFLFKIFLRGSANARCCIYSLCFGVIVVGRL